MGLKHDTTYRRTSEHYPSSRGAARSAQWITKRQEEIMGRRTKLSINDTSYAKKIPFLYREATTVPAFRDIFPQFKRNLSSPTQIKLLTEVSNETLMSRYKNSIPRIKKALKHAHATLKTTGIYTSPGAIFERGLDGNYVSLLPDEETTEVAGQELDYLAKELRLDRGKLHTPEAQTIGSFNSASRAEAATEIINNHIADIGGFTLILGNVKIATNPLF